MHDESRTIVVRMPSVISDRFVRASFPTNMKNSQKQSMMYTESCCTVSANTVGTGRI